MSLLNSVPRSFKHLRGQDATRLMGAASFVFFCRVLGAAIVFATQILLARWMGPKELGLYVYAFAWCTLLATVAGLGLPSAIFRFIGIGLAQPANSLVVSFSRFGRHVTLITGLLIGAAGIVLIQGVIPFHSSADSNVLLIALAIVPIYALIRWYSSLANALSSFHLASLPRVVLRPLFLLLAVYFAWLAEVNLSAATVMLANMAIMLLIFIPQCTMVERAMRRHFPHMHESRYQSAYWMRLALPQLLSTIFVNNFFELNLVVVGLYLPADQLAILNAAFRTALIIFFGIQAMDVITWPHVARLYAAGDTEVLQRTVLRSTYIKFIGALGGMVILAILGRPVMRVFGPDFVVGYHALVILAFSQVVTAGIGMGAQLLNVSGHQNECLAIFLCSAILMIGLHTILVPRFGMDGAAVAVVVVAFIQSWWIKAVVERRLNIFPALISRRRSQRKEAGKER